MATPTSPEQSNPLGPKVEGPEPPFPHLKLLLGTTVRLERLRPAHADDLYAVLGGPEHAHLWDYVLSAPLTDRAAFRSYISQRVLSSDPYDMAIIDLTSGKAVGSASFYNIRPAHRVIEVGFVMFSPLLQRTRAATEAMFLMARHVFEELGYRRYEWKANDLNERSKRAARRLGFEFEGVFRRHMVVKGRSRDTAWFAMIDEDWPVVKAAFEKWLDPGNFDAGGEQRVGLAALRDSTLMQHCSLDVVQS